MASIASELDVAQPEKAFEASWSRDPYDVPTVRTVHGSELTPTLQTLQERVYKTQDELPEGEQSYHGMAIRSFQAAKQGDAGTVTQDVVDEMESRGVIDRGVAENSTPLVFDPEVLDILNSEAPLAQRRLPTEGQDGYKAVYNQIDSRDAPIGYVSEQDSTDVLDDASGMNLARGEVDMSIFVDSASIADFSAKAAAHYVDLEDLTLGARLAEYAQLKEQTVLYGNPDHVDSGSSNPVNDGGPADPNAFHGLESIYSDAGNVEDKSGFDLSANDLVDDLKAEIKELLQGPYGVNKSDLEIWTSHTVEDRIESELTSMARHDTNDERVDYGHEDVSINGVGVYPSHNVDNHVYTDGDGDTYDVGDEGDVFIVNTRSTRFRQLAPLSTVPLGARGLADEVAMFEYGALIDRAGGNFGKKLSAYSV